MSKLLIAVILIVAVALAIVLWKSEGLQEQSSSFVGYSQSCWQVENILYVVSNNGDTVKIDISKIEKP